MTSIDCDTLGPDPRARAELPVQPDPHDGRRGLGRLHGFRHAGDPHAGPGDAGPLRAAAGPWALPDGARRGARAHGQWLRPLPQDEHRDG